MQTSIDPSGLPIGTQLQASVAVFQQDSTNVQQGKSVLQTADGALAQISNVLQRMMALATEAASGQVTDTQRRQDIGTEYTQLSGEISDIVQGTRYAGQTLLTGSFLSNTKYLVGTLSGNTITVTVNSASLAALMGSAGSTVSTAATALQAMAAVNSAITSVTQDRAQIGAYESQFNFSSQAIEASLANAPNAASVILDSDVASVKSQLSANDVRTQAGVAALTQASQLPQELLRLIQS